MYVERAGLVFINTILPSVVLFRPFLVDGTRNITSTKQEKDQNQKQEIKGRHVRDAIVDDE